MAVFGFAPLKYLGEHAVDILWDWFITEDVAVDGPHVDTVDERFSTMLLCNHASCKKIEDSVGNVGACFAILCLAIFVMLFAVELHVLVAISCYDVNLVVEGKFVHFKCFGGHATVRSLVVGV